MPPSDAAQLRGLDARIATAQAEQRALQRSPVRTSGHRLSCRSRDYGEPNYWLTCLTIDPDEFGTDRERLDARSRRPGHRVHGRPGSPFIFNRSSPSPETVGGNVAAGIFERGLCLPSGSGLSDEDFERVVKAVVDTGCGR